MGKMNPTGMLEVKGGAQDRFQRILTVLMFARTKDSNSFKLEALVSITQAWE